MPDSIFSRPLSGFESAMAKADSLVRFAGTTPESFQRFDFCFRGHEFAMMRERTLVSDDVLNVYFELLSAKLVDTGCLFMSTWLLVKFAEPHYDYTSVANWSVRERAAATPDRVRKIFFRII